MRLTDDVIQFFEQCQRPLAVRHLLVFAVPYGNCMQGEVCLRKRRVVTRRLRLSHPNLRPTCCIPVATLTDPADGVSRCQHGASSANRIVIDAVE